MFVHTSLVADGFNRHQISRTLATNTPMRKTITKLEASVQIVGTETTIRNDLSAGASIIHDDIKKRLKMTLASDVLFGDVPSLIKFSGGDHIPLTRCSKMWAYYDHLEANTESDGALSVCLRMSGPYFFFFFFK